MQEEYLRVSSQNQIELFGQDAESCRQFADHATAAESAHCGAVASTAVIATNLYGDVGKIK